MGGLILSERIKGPMYEALIDYGKKAKVSAENRKRWIEIVTKEKYAEHTVITFDMLPNVLDVLSLSVKELYGLMGVDMQYPDDDFEELCAICDLLPKDILDRIIRGLSKIVPSFYHECGNQGFPSKRIIEFHRRIRANRKERLVGNDDEVISLRSAYNGMPRVRPERFPEVAVKRRMSMHWILGGHENMIVYGSKSETNTIMDLYSFLSAKNQMFFMEMMRNSFRNSNIENHSVSLLSDV